MNPLMPKGGEWENCGPTIAGDGILFIKGDETVISSVQFNGQLHLAIMRRKGTDFDAIRKDFGAEDFEEDIEWRFGLCKHFWKNVEPQLCKHFWARVNFP